MVEWLSKLPCLETDAALDLLFDRVDDLLIQESFEQVDGILSQVEVGKLSVPLLLGVLTVTLPARDHLPQRNSLVTKIEIRLEALGQAHRIDDLLRGLR